MLWLRYSLLFPEDFYYVIEHPRNIDITPHFILVPVKFRLRNRDDETRDGKGRGVAWRKAERDDARSIDRRLRRKVQWLQPFLASARLSLFKTAWFRSYIRRALSLSIFKPCFFLFAKSRNRPRIFPSPAENATRFLYMRRMNARRVHLSVLSAARQTGSWEYTPFSDEGENCLSWRLQFVKPPLAGAINWSTLTGTLSLLKVEL